MKKLLTMFILKNDRGISLIQVMIAIALLASVQVMFMRINQTQNKSVKTTETKFEAIGALNSIREILSDKDACYQTFGITAGTPNTATLNNNANLIAPGVITEILSSTGSIVYESNIDPDLAPQIGSSRLKILSFRVNSDDLTPIAANSSGVTDVFVKFDRGEIYGSEVIEKRFKLNVRTDANSDIIDCRTGSVGDSVSTIAQYMCDSLGGTWDPTGRAVFPALVGNGDCHTLNPNGTTTFNGNMVINDTFSFDFLSDKNLKHDVLELENSLQKIRNLKPVSYRWNKNGKKEIGFIAQEVKEIYPDFVKKTPSGRLAVKYPQMVSAALKGIKELDAINSENRKELDYMLSEQELLKQQLYDLKLSLCSYNKSLSICDHLGE